MIKRAERTPPATGGDIAARVGTYVVLAIMVLTTLYPMLWMVFGSLKSDAEFYSNIWGPPRQLTWTNYSEAWTAARIGVYFVNSIIITAATIMVSLSFTALSAYAFARLRFPGSTLLFWFFLASLMMPTGVLVIPIFAVVAQLGLVDTRLSMVLVYAGSGMAFGTFVLRAYFISIPRELEEAAMIDGATPFGAFWRIVLPLATPGLATQLVFIGLGTWNEYLLASILVRSKELRTLPLGLVAFVQQYTTHYPQYFAALVLITLPVVVLYLFAQRLFMSGLTAGALKG